MSISSIPIHVLPHSDIYGRNAEFGCVLYELHVTQLPHTVCVSDYLLCFLQGDAYPTYIAVFYLLAAVILAHAVLTLWAAVMLKKDDNASVWVKGKT